MRSADESRRAVVDITDAAALAESIGSELGVSEWVTMTQADVDTYAHLAGDDQWIHVDPDRARNSSYGGTVVHALLTLSLGPRFLYELTDWSSVSSALNYGFNRVRVPSPLPTGSRVRMRLAVLAVDMVDGGHQVTFMETFEREGHEKPVCVAEFIARIYT